MNKQFIYENIIPRENITVDNISISKELKNKKVLVTGAGGSIGRELCKRLITFKPLEIHLLGKSKNNLLKTRNYIETKETNVVVKIHIANITNFFLLSNIFETVQPNIVFHTAACKHIPFSEENPHEAVTNNVIGTKNLIDIADKYLVEKFMFLSSDKAVYPLSIMGMTKRISELTINSLLKGYTKFYNVRLGNVIGSRGSFVPVILDKIAQGHPITITNPNMERYFLTMPDTVNLILQSLVYTEGGETFLLKTGPPIKITELVNNILKLLKLDVNSDVEVKFIGIREGEKLKETLSYEYEEIVNTKHPQIIRIKGVQQSYHKIEYVYSKLNEISPKDQKKIKQLLMDTISKDIKTT